MTVHSLIGASAAHRWMNCPGSVSLIRDNGLGGESSPYAEQGSRAHTLAESCLKRGLVGVPKGECDDPEMVRGVRLFLAQVWKAFAVHPGRGKNELLTEQSFQLAHIHEQCFGTLDAAVYQSATRTLHIFDFKYGAGVPVEVEGNAQLLYYALGALCGFEEKGVHVDSIVITIVQPRFDHPDGPVRSWPKAGEDGVRPAGLMELLDFEMALGEAIERLETHPDELNPGKWCKFCPARVACPALHKNALQVAASEFEVIPAGDVKAQVRLLTLDEAAKRYEFVKWLQMYAGALYGYLLAEAERGRLAPGFKLVPKQGRRKWKDATAARGHVTSLCGAEGLVLRTPAQIEKLVGKKAFKDLAHLAEAKSGGVKLVPTANKGVALTALDFEPLDEDDGDEDGSELD